MYVCLYLNLIYTLLILLQSDSCSHFSIYTLSFQSNNALHLAKSVLDLHLPGPLSSIWQHLTQFINSPRLEMFSSLGSQAIFLTGCSISGSIVSSLSLNVGGPGVWVLSPALFSVYAHSVGDLTQPHGFKNHFHNDDSCVNLLGLP